MLAYNENAVLFSDNLGNPVAYIPGVGIGYVHFDPRMPMQTPNDSGDFDVVVGGAAGGLAAWAAGTLADFGKSAKARGLAGLFIGAGAEFIADLLEGDADMRTPEQRAADFGVAPPTGSPPLLLTPAFRDSLAGEITLLYVDNPLADAAWLATGIGRVRRTTFAMRR